MKNPNDALKDFTRSSVPFWTEGLNVFHQLLKHRLALRGQVQLIPMSIGFSRFGTVSIRIYFQALSRLSWLSFSPPVFSTGRRDWLKPRLHSSPNAGSPRKPG